MRLLLALLLTCSPILANAAVCDQKKEHPQYSGEPVTVLRSISRDFHTPFIAELVFSRRPVIVKKGTHTPRELFQQLAGRDDVVIDCGTDFVHLKDRRFARSTHNLFNVKLERFEMPNSVELLQISLPARARSALEKTTYSAGGAISVITDPKFKKASLKPQTLSNVTVREILQAAMSQHPFSVVLISRTAKPDGPQDIDFQLKNWYWLSLDRIIDDVQSSWHSLRTFNLGFVCATQQGGQSAMHDEPGSPPGRSGATSRRHPRCSCA
jgi:hypothetical protein